MMVFRAWLVGIALCAASIILASQVVWADGDGNALLRRGMDWLLAAKTAEAKTAFGACMEAGERGFVHRCAIADLAASRLRGEDGGQRVRALLGGGVRDLASSDDVHAHALAAFLGELPARFVADKTMEAILTHPERGSANTARLSQAYYYAGLLAMVSGDAAGAGKQFSRSVSANARTPEGGWSESFLAIVGGNAPTDPAGPTAANNRDVAGPIPFEFPDLAAALKEGRCPTSPARLAFAVVTDAPHGGAAVAKARPEITERLMRHLRTLECGDLEGLGGVAELRRTITRIIGDTTGGVADASIAITEFKP